MEPGDLGFSYLSHGAWRSKGLVTYLSQAMHAYIERPIAKNCFQPGHAQLNHDCSLP